MKREGLTTGRVMEIALKCKTERGYQSGETLNIEIRCMTAVRLANGHRTEGPGNLTISTCSDMPEEVMSVAQSLTACETYAGYIGVKSG